MSDPLGNTDNLPCIKPKFASKSVIHLLKVLSIFNKLFQKNLRFRDRSVKIIQYGCQMISGYFSPYLPPSVNSGISCLRREASNSRKWMWLLKSVQHVIWLYDKTFSKNKLNRVQQYDYLEQIFLVLYYAYENKVLFSRLKIPGFSEERDDFPCNFTWFLGDLFLTCSGSLSLYDNLYQIRKISARIKEMRNETQIISTDLVEKDIKRLNYLESIVLFFIDQNFKLFDSKYDDFYDSNKINNLNLQELEKLLDDMIENRKSSYLAWAIALYELGVSAHYSGCFKFIYGSLSGNPDDYCLSDGPIGFMGVMSSSLILFQYYRDLPK